MLNHTVYSEYHCRKVKEKQEEEERGAFNTLIFFCLPEGATKSALDMLTKSMALELGPHKVSTSA